MCKLLQQPQSKKSSTHTNLKDIVPHSSWRVAKGARAEKRHNTAVGCVLPRQQSGEPGTDTICELRKHAVVPWNKPAATQGAIVALSCKVTFEENSRPLSCRSCNMCMYAWCWIVSGSKLNKIWTKRSPPPTHLNNSHCSYLVDKGKKCVLTTKGCLTGEVIKIFHVEHKSDVVVDTLHKEQK